MFLIVFLICCPDRPDVNESGMRTAVYEAIMAFIQYHAKDCEPHVHTASWIIMERLRASLDVQVCGSAALAPLLSTTDN